MRVNNHASSGARRIACGTLCVLAVACVTSVMAEPPAWDPFSDTWVATDALGRRLSAYAETNGPRADRTVGIFYFLWHGEHIQGGPYDVTKILAQDPDAMQKKDSPLWGPMHAPHHWGESIFGYYLADDEGVLRKHAQMLSDAGVDVVIFDVTNQYTYRRWYTALLRVWTEMRQMGNPTPQVAFLCPFWNPQKVVHELWRELYGPGLYRDLWFEWDGKPLILADPTMIYESSENTRKTVAVPLQPGHTLGQSFQADGEFRAVGGCFPTWNSSESSLTLTLYREGPGGKALTRQRFEHVSDNAWLLLQLSPPEPAGDYYLEISDASGRIGWWSQPQDTFAAGRAFSDGEASDGDRTVQIQLVGGDDQEILDFFSFRKPQPDYFKGPTRPDMWSWLEVYPQHVFRNSRGEKEQMSVGVGQNAVEGRLGSMSEAGAHGRSFHNGAFDRRPDAVLHGYNVTEQWERALQEDPRFIFITGWNEWIAGRFDSFGGVSLPVMFVDQFDQEHSRDIEPMKGGHGDSYYYQMVDYIRRYKGTRPIPPVRSQTVTIDGEFRDWREVQPEFRDTVGDAVQRQHRGWDPAVVYTNQSGRNDVIVSKFSYTRDEAFFYVQTRERLTPYSGPNWMVLFLDVDADATTGWLGYDFAVNRAGIDADETPVERYDGTGQRWTEVCRIPWRSAESELELRIPWPALGVQATPRVVDFKWADNIQQSGHWSDFTRYGDAAPNDRFNFRAVLSQP